MLVRADIPSCIFKRAAAGGNSDGDDNGMPDDTSCMTDRTGGYSMSVASASLVKTKRGGAGEERAAATNSDPYFEEMIDTAPLMPMIPQGTNVSIGVFTLLHHHIRYIKGCLSDIIKKLNGGYREG